jgi:peptidoglycan/xylan/chitin deacetylase (PgdA/CDA1 family)
LGALELAMSVNVRKLIKAAGGRAAAAAGMYARDFRSKMVVVAFHRVDDRLPGDGLTCSGTNFAAFCRFFRRYFEVVPFSEQVAGVRARRDMGGTLSITFDDGYLDNFEVAVPILRKLGLPATFFIATGFIGSKVVPEWDKHLPVQPGWMNWDQLRTLAAQGFEFGCHTDTHIDMGSVDEHTVRTELELSRQKLKKELGVSADLFAYPFGGMQHMNQRSLQVVRELGFSCCASCYGGSNPSLVDPYDIHRIGIAGWLEIPHQFGFELLTNRA